MQKSKIKHDTGALNYWKWVSLIVLSCGTTFLLAGCPGSKPPSDGTNNGSDPGKTTAAVAPFKITINSWIGFAPLYIAQEKGLFAKEGVKVELVRIEDTGARKSSMLSNQVDAYGASVDGVALDTAQGGPAQAVMVFDQSNGADGIIAKNSIQNAAALKGKTVAAQPGLTSYFMLMYYLQKNGLTNKDVNITDMDSDKAGAAFAAGRVDVAVTWEPWLTKSQEQGGHKLVTSAQLPGVIVDTLAVTDKARTEKRDQTKAVIRAWFAALDYIKAHPEESNTIMAKSLSLKEQEVKDYLSGVKFFNKAENKAYLGTKEKPGQIYDIYGMASGIWQSAGIIPKPTKAEDHIDPSLVQEIL